MLSIAMLCYLAVSSGVVVNFHYCMNRLASTELFAFETERCGKCGMDIHESDGCCRDEVQLVKMDDDQKAAPVFVFNLPGLNAVTISPSVYLAAAFHQDIPVAGHHNHSPPLLASPDLYLQHSVFRI
jgi:hypothetical protein